MRNLPTWNTNFANSVLESSRSSKTERKTANFNVNHDSLWRLQRMEFQFLNFHSFAHFFKIKSTYDRAFYFILTISNDLLQ